MDKIIKIQENDIVKYYKMIYLVKNFKKIDNYKYQLNYHFKTNITKKNAKLHKNQLDEFDKYKIERIKHAEEKEREILISKIQKESPDFNLSTFEIYSENKNSELNESNCIEYLKNKGYLIYKQT